MPTSNQPAAGASHPDVELERTVRAGTEQLLSRVGAAFAAQQGWANQLRAAAYELRDFLREDEARARAMMIEAPRGNEETRRIREQGIAALTVLIDLGRAELDDVDSVPRSAAEIAAGVIYNRIHVEVERGAELDDEMVRELMYTAVLPYQGIEAALAELKRPSPPPTQPQATSQASSAPSTGARPR
ncbi:MAG: hypothetical protein QOF06_1663 [Solirubrobacterales bacterium]|jgi:hypothetical protein|nr:hypothetical protein [Solirubrobacterales bacterium]